jgi:hypothetical protein
VELPEDVAAVPEEPDEPDEPDPAPDEELEPGVVVGVVVD